MLSDCNFQLAHKLINGVQILVGVMSNTLLILASLLDIKAGPNYFNIEFFLSD